MSDHDDDDLSAGGHTLEARLGQLCAPTLADLGYDLVRVSVLGRDRPTVQVMADRTDGSLIGVEDCERISRALGAVLDVEDPMPRAWQLEISSAGIDRPLTRVKDWNRYSGHAARVEMLMPIDGRKRYTGVVLGADADTARLRLEDGDVSLPMAQVRRAKLLLTDALIEATKPDAVPN